MKYKIEKLIKLFKIKVKSSCLHLGIGGFLSLRIFFKSKPFLAHGYRLGLRPYVLAPGYRMGLVEALPSRTLGLPPLLAS